MLLKIIENQISEEINSGCVKYSNKPIPANIIIQDPTNLMVPVARRRKSMATWRPSPTIPVTKIMRISNPTINAPRP